MSERDNAFYKELTINELKEKIITHYLAYFCERRESLPSIKLCYFVDDILTEEDTITSADIPELNKQEELSLHYSRFLSDNKTIEKTSKAEQFNLKGL